MWLGQYCDFFELEIRQHKGTPQGHEPFLHSVQPKVVVPLLLWYRKNGENIRGSGEESAEEGFAPSA